MSHTEYVVQKQSFVRWCALKNFTIFRKTPVLETLVFVWIMRIFLEKYFYRTLPMAASGGLNLAWIKITALELWRSLLLCFFPLWRIWKNGAVTELRREKYRNLLLQCLNYVVDIKLTGNFIFLNSPEK